VAEETGIQATAGKRLDIEHYGTALGPKAVEFWAMHGQDGPFRPTAEVDRLAWMSLADARWRLRYRRDSYPEPASGSAIVHSSLDVASGSGSAFLSA